MQVLEDELVVSRHLALDRSTLRCDYIALRRNDIHDFKFKQVLRLDVTVNQSSL